MVMPYVFYKRVKARDIPVAVMSQSAAFNNVLAPASIRKVYGALRNQGYLLQRVTLSEFTKYMLSPEEDLFRELRLVRKYDGKEVVRLIPRSQPVSPYAIALSLSTHAYVSHYSALYLHGLTLNVPKPIYVKSRRTKAKNPPHEPDELTQEQLDSAFSLPARMTRNIYTFDYEGTTHEVYLLEKSAEIDNGITKVPAPHAPSGIAVSGVEKTLVECAIKTNYAGGAGEVLDAFRRARETLKILRMMQLLKNGHYLFPYEKNILFYMDRAGYSEQQKKLVTERSRQDKTGFTTYLEKGMHGKLLDPGIGIYYPQGMASE
jgi:predicted transcriptional regulator of viral defense system